MGQDGTVSNTVGNPSDLSVDCQVSEWESTEGCTKEGKMVFTRDIIKYPKNDGTSCDTLYKLEFNDTCNIEPFQMTEWTNTEACNSEGKMVYTRNIINHSRSSAEFESNTVKYEDTLTCKVEDCKMTEWISSGACDNEGKMVYTRSIITFPKNGGKECEEEISKHNLDPMCRPVNCKMSEWQSLEVCLNNKEIRKRTILTAASNGGKECDNFFVDFVDSVLCAPVDCKIKEWSNGNICIDGEEQFYKQIEGLPINGGNCDFDLLVGKKTENCVELNENIKRFMQNITNVRTNITSYELKHLVHQQFNLTSSQMLDKDFYFKFHEHFYSLINRRVDCETSEWSAVGECIMAINTNGSFFFKDKFIREIITPSRAAGNPCGDLIKYDFSAECSKKMENEIKSFSNIIQKNSEPLLWLFLCLMLIQLFIIIPIFWRNYTSSLNKKQSLSKRLDNEPLVDT